MNNSQKAKSKIIRLMRMLYKHINMDQYFALNPDVYLAGMHPLHHIIKHAWLENRKISPDTTMINFLAANPLISDHIRSITDSMHMMYVDKIFIRDNACRHGNDVRFIGYFESKLGLGIAAKNTIDCYRQISNKFSIYPYNNAALNRFESKYLPEKYNTHSHHKINIFELGLDNVEHALENVCKTSTRKMYNVLKLYWELSEIPEEKIEALTKFDEIWVPSKFIYDAVVKIYNKKAFIIPPFVDTKRQKHFKRNHFRMGKDLFYFLFSFDYNSSIHRKNPLAVIKAFRAAFPDNQSVRLILKSNNPKDAAINSDFVENLKSFDNRIIFIEDYLDRSSMLSLIQCCDCYVSLHRSEGYGMGMAEAICFGRKVVATNYSGNVDFINNNNSFAVDYRLINIENGEYFLSQGMHWANPIHNSAVKQLRLAYNNKPSLLDKLMQRRKLYRSEIPTKAAIAKMIHKRIVAIKSDNDFV